MNSFEKSFGVRLPDRASIVRNFEDQIRSNVGGYVNPKLDESIESLPKSSVMEVLNSPEIQKILSDELARCLLGNYAGNVTPKLQGLLKTIPTEPLLRALQSPEVQEILSAELIEELPRHNAGQPTRKLTGLVQAIPLPALLMALLSPQVQEKILGKIAEFSGRSSPQTKERFIALAKLLPKEALEKPLAAAGVSLEDLIGATS